MKIAVIILLLIFSIAYTCGCRNVENAVLEEGNEMAALLNAPLEFQSTEELLLVIRHYKVGKGPRNGDALDGLDFFFKPKWIPDSARIHRISIRETYCTYLYIFGDSVAADIDDPGNRLVFEWKRGWGPENVTSFYTQQGFDYDTLIGSQEYYVKSFTHSTTDSSSTFRTVYWTQHDLVFHAEVPISFSNDDIMLFCDAEKVQD
jgi:hypothetical protein